ncbi:MAG: ATP cone domain-containing protein, partial [Planctomycetota bacterium]|nr:ATP cone domain-containing protein [Planctomycetota bacterium]
MLRRIIKRDGTEVPFERERIRAAVARAQSAVGDDDQLFAREVADVVTLTLERTHAMTPGEDGLEATRFPAQAPSAGSHSQSAPTVEEIQDLVERALVQMGRAPVAKAYILYRAGRGQLRDALRVERPPSAPHTIVSDEDSTEPWSRSHLIQTLINDAALTRPMAEETAERVEQRVLGLGLRRVSSSLVRELVAGELAAMGLTAALRQREPIGLSRRELRELLAAPQPAALADLPGASFTGADGAPPEPAGRALDSALGERVLRRYTFDDILGEQNADLFRAGELALAQPGAPHLPLTLSVPCSLLLATGPGTGPSAAFDILEELGPLAASCSRGLVLEEAGPLLAQLQRAGGRGNSRGEGLRPWLKALSALSRTAGRWLDLSRPGGRSPRLLEALLHALADLDEGHGGFPAPRLFLTAQEARAALDGAGSAGRDELALSMEKLLRSGRLIPTWDARDAAGQALRGASEELFAAPGCRRRGGEGGVLACGGAVAFHLPRLARRAGPWREEHLFEALATRIEQSLDALAHLAEFQRLHHRPQPGGLHPRRSFALVPVGLPEALRILGDGQIRADQGARLLGLAADAARRFSAGRGLVVTLSPFFGSGPAKRFAELDARMPGWNQGLLFAEAAVDEHGAAALIPNHTREAVAYGTGFSLATGDGLPAALPLGGQRATQAQALGALLCAVPSGALVHLPRGAVGLQSSSRGLPENLGAWLELEEMRRSRLAQVVPPLSGTALRSHDPAAPGQTPVGQGDTGAAEPWPLYAEDVISQEPHESREPHESHESREPRESHEARESHESRDSHDSHDSHDSREAREARDAPDPAPRTPASKT